MTGLWHTGGMTGGSDRSDAELIASTDSSGDAFSALYERHVDDVLRYFVRRTNCAQTAADLTAETFTAALISRRRFRDTGVPGRAWLFKIAQRQLGRFIRTEAVSKRARRRLGVEIVALSDLDFERVEQLVDFEPIARAVRDAIQTLPTNQSAAVRLRVAEGRSYGDVAARLGCTEGAARVRVTRGLSTLADQLGEL